MTPMAAVSDFGGQRYHGFVSFNFLLSLAAPHLHGVLVTGNKFIASVVVTGNKFIGGGAVTGVNDSGEKSIAGINDTGDYCKSVKSLVTVPPVNSLLWVSLTPVINIHSRIFP